MFTSKSSHLKSSFSFAWIKAREKSSLLLIRSSKKNKPHIKHSQILILFQVVQNMSLPSRHANMKTTAKTERGKGPRLLFVLIDKRIIQNMSLPSRHANYFLTCKTGFLISKDRDFLFVLLTWGKTSVNWHSLLPKKKVFWSPFNYP